MSSFLAKHLRWFGLPLCLFSGLTVSAQTIYLEAEKAQLMGPTLRIAPAAPRAGTLAKEYSGSGYVTGFEQPSDQLVFKVAMAQAGLYDLGLRYRAPLRKGFDITVNGRQTSGSFLPTTNKDFWSMSAGQVELAAGENTIVVHRGSGYFDFDYLSLTLKSHTLPLPPVLTSPVDPDINPEARALLKSLDAGYGKATALGVYSDDDAAYVRLQAGVSPAIMGGDLMEYSPFFRTHETPKTDEIARLIRSYHSGQLITLSWHWGSPAGALDSPEKPWWRAFYTDSTNFDVARAVDPFSAEHAAILADMDAIAVQLRRLQDAHIPVLWRPLHEAQGGWFWWGAKGPEPYKKLWTMLYDRLTRVDGIHNLLWVYTGGDDPAWYPGDSMVDVVGIDAYPSDLHNVESPLWNLLQERFAGRKPIAMSEFGGIPDIPSMQRFGEYWLYAVSWSGKEGPHRNTPAEVKRIYTSAGVTTLPSP